MGILFPSLESKCDRNWNPIATLVSVLELISFSKIFTTYFSQSTYTGHIIYFSTKLGFYHTRKISRYVCLYEKPLLNVADGHTLILVRNLQEVISFGKRKRIIHDDYRDFLLNWRKKHLFKPIAILFGIFFFYAFSGQLPFCVHTALILKSLNMKEHVPLLVLGLNLTRLSVVCLAMLFSLKIGRTYIYMASGLLMTGCFIGMTLTKIFLDEPSVIIPSLLVVFIFFNFLGFISLVHVLTPEIMPKNFRSTVSSSIIIFDALIRFSITKAFPELIEAIGIEYVLVIFAGFTFLSTLFVLIFVPETHKKTQEDIPQLFSSQ